MVQGKAALMNDDQNDIVHIPIDGTLDLHTFNPRDVHDLIKEYIDACLEEGILEIRIIHGKGRGVLRDKVHSILRRHPLVMDFSLDPGTSGWGATVIRLKKKVLIPDN
jgi:DNA-nicking Smr family endonuclease